MAAEVTPAAAPLQDRPTQAGATKLGSTTTLTGDLESHEDILLEGRVKGRITLPSGTLTIARGAKVEAEIRVRSLVLHGELTGNVFAGERVVISESGRMKGDIAAPKIAISSGAQFKGGIKMGNV
jgi:cytoskeletal protein CcmA (bactofilin family)